MLAAFRRIVRIGIILNLVASALFIQAQDYRMGHFGVAEGLPSSEVYCVLQDQLGYLWFGTDRGAVRYDGYQFEVFTTEEGLRDNTVFQLYEDALGRIWFGTYSPEMVYFQNDSMHLFEHNDVIRKAGVNATIKTGMYIDDEGTFYLATLGEGMLVIDANGNLHAEGHRGNPFFSIRDQFGAVSVMGPGASLAPGYGSDFPLPYPGYMCLDHGKGDYQLVEFKEAALVYISDFLPINERNLVLGVEQNLVFFRDKTPIDTVALPAGVDWLYLDDESRIWVGLLEGGAMVFDTSGQPLPIFLPQLQGQTISGIVRDMEGGYWFSSTQKGVYHLPSLDFRYHQFPDSLTRPVSDLLITGDDKVFVAQQDIGVFMLESQSEEPWRMESVSPGHRGTIKLIQDREDGKLLIVSQPIYKWDDGRMVRKSSFKITRGVKDILYRANGEMWACGRRGLFRIAGSPVTGRLDTVVDSAEMWAIHEDENEQLWIGTPTGLHRYAGSGKTEPFEGHHALRNRVMDFAGLPGGGFAVATLGGGIVLIHGDSIRQINQGDGLASNLINCVVTDAEGLIWAGSGRGLHRITIGDGGMVRIKNYGFGEGMPFLEVHQVAIRQDKIWLAGPKGVASVARNQEQEAGQSAPIYLQSFQINRRDTTLQPGYRLKHWQNDLRVSFLGLRFRGEGAVEYRYRLAGLDKSWRYTTDTVVSYPGLAPGSYTFEVAARNSIGKWSDPSATVELLIEPAFWQEWWFLPLMLLVVLSFSGIIAWYFIRQWQQRLKRERSLEQWKMKALRARMDPHFIFNTLNTIQAYITTHDMLAAEKYLNKFSRLVRRVLHQSDADSIPLADEVRMLVLYMELEQMRFSGSFRFELVVDPEVDQENTAIPGMLVQPFVENAILHGLLPRRGGGELKVSFARENGNLRCTVRDNGIGRAAARALREARGDGHRSTGLELVRSRLRLLSDEDSTSEKIIIHDLVSADGKAAGTEIIFDIPILT